MLIFEGELLMEYIVHKFGGSSLADVVKIERVVNIIGTTPQSVVVSASGKTTSLLKKSIELALENKDSSKVIAQLTEHHLSLISTLCPEDKALKSAFESDVKHLKQMLTTIALSGICGDALEYFILGFGELWSAQILTGALQYKGMNTEFIDASEVLFIDDNHKPVSVDWQRSQQAVDQKFNDRKHKTYIITGFIAQNQEGVRSILGMNCSDYSSAIFAKLLQASKLVIWTDVAGVYSANPQVVKTARQLKQLSYKEALELAYFGASVVHPLTINPMMEMGIPIEIKSSYEPQKEGTEIIRALDKTNLEQYLIKGLTSISNVALMRVQGAGIIGVSGMAAKVFSVLEQSQVSVMMISQSSSEYSICFAIEAKLAKRATKALERHFKAEIERGDIEHIYCETGYAMITAVGDGLRAQPGALARVIKPLADAKINIHAITQGSSERSITVTVKKEDEDLALNLIHQQAKNPPVQEMVIALIGVGGIGAELVNQLKQQQQVLHKQNINLRLVAVMSSTKLLCADDLLLESELLHQLKASDCKADTNALAKYLQSISCAHKVLVDATASVDIARVYVDFLAQGIHVVTPNKYANTQSMDYYRKLRQVARNHNVTFKYETNVCAGLPLISTIETLQKTGDKIHKIQGVFSGTLSFIFNEVNKGKSFVESLMLAYDKGYTEPDPREDLSGMDVARKVVCLAREIGVSLELSDVEVQNLTPENLRSCSKEEFLKEIKAHDKELTQQLKVLQGKASALHFVGEVSDTGEAKVSVAPLAQNSPFVSLDGADNMVLVYSKRYAHSPMVIRGAGAGVEVTAAGVFGDILAISN
ncbi:bifunctional aspartate kinase/homoserine dehydrogenase I [Cysteiniphilum litorale]|uniref:bifunctional aspartate kinase/homoserine dehydrogenase I n=1 Tax=Cysteiniphilum litorale TaxID=2056700 RepID=UPI003F884A89